MRNLRLRNLLRRRVLAALVLGTAVLGGTIVYAQASRVTTTYRTALVTYATITQSIGMAGNLTPVNEADLNFASAGTVQNLYVQVGQTVGAGTPLATLDATLLSAQLLQAQATLSSAQAKLAQDQAGPTTQSLTSAQNSVASALVAMNNAQTSLADTQPSNDQAAAQLASMQQQYSAAKSSLSAQQTSTSPQTIQMDDAQISIDQVNVNTVQHQLDGATLTSPIPGVVSQVNIKIGQSVTGG